MNKNAIAAQMYTIRDFTQTAQGLAESLAKLRAIGYEAVQLSAVGAMNGDAPEVSPEQARTMLDDNGLKCIATHRNWDALANQSDREIALHHALGCDFTAIGGLPGRFAEQGAEGFRQFLSESAPVIARLKDAGIRFGYHNHDWEFRRVSPEASQNFQSGTSGTPPTLLDIFINEGGPDFLMEIDLYWVNHAGVNPVRVLERLAGRVPVIHIKDKEVVAKDGPVMAPIGEGNLDWNNILPACEAAGVQWYAVEQDECRRDPFNCLRSSFEYLMGR